MGKISNAFLMIDLLNSGNKYTVKELADRLKISERMVRYYKDELEKSGIYIESFKGPNGGYFILNNSGYYTKINKYDIELLKSSYKELEKASFKHLPKVNFLINKLESLNTIEEEKSKFIIDNNFEEEIDVISILEKYINDKTSLTIIYEDFDGSLKNRIIHPLYLFKYKEIIYVTAYCELRNDIRHFEISRIKLKK